MEKFPTAEYERMEPEAKKGWKRKQAPCRPCKIQAFSITVKPLLAAFCFLLYELLIQCDLHTRWACW